TVRPPSQAAFMIFLGLIWAGAGGLCWAGQPYIAAAVFAVSLTPLFWYRSRLKSSRSVQNKLFEFAARFAACQMELEKTEEEARDIEAEIRKLTGQSEITQQDIDIRTADLAGLQKAGDDLRKIDDGISHCETEVRMIERQMEETRSRIYNLLEEGRAANH